MALKARDGRNVLSLAPTSLGDVGPVEFINICAKAGFDAVGLRVQPSPGRPFTPLLGHPERIAEIKQTLQDTGMGVLELFTFFMVPDIDWDDYRHALEIGAGFGAINITVCGNDPDWDRMVDSYGRFCDLAAEFGLGATAEFAPVHALSTLEKAVALYKAVDRPNAGILVDPIHFMRSGGTIEQLKAVDSSFFPFAQIADGLLQGDEPPVRLLTGDGNMPLAEILDCMPCGVPLSVESLPRPDGMSAQTWADELARTTRAFLDAYYSSRPAA